MDVNLPVVYRKYSGAITLVVFVPQTQDTKINDASTIFIETHWVKPVQMSQYLVT